MSCPICTRAPEAAYRPFCSKRCADVDLARWLGGAYAVPSEDPEDIEAAIEATIEATTEATTEAAIEATIEAVQSTAPKH